MTPQEAEILSYLGLSDYRSTHELARHFRCDLPGIELIMRSLLAHGQVEEDGRRYYRLNNRGRDDLIDFRDHWITKPFGEGRRPI